MAGSSWSSGPHARVCQNEGGRWSTRKMYSQIYVNGREEQANRKTDPGVQVVVQVISKKYFWILRLISQK